MPDLEIIDLGALPKTRATARVALSLLVESRKKAATLKFRFERFFLPETWIYRSELPVRQRILWLLRGLKFVIGKSLENAHIFVYLSPTFRYLAKVRFFRSDPMLAIPSALKQQSLDWMIIPCASPSSFVTDLLRFYENRDTRTIVAMDNWDNLTSKSVFPVHPDFITVMGKKDIHYAKLIHEINEEKVLPYGLPRLDVYRLRSREKVLKFSDVIQILYCGFSLAHSEMKVIDGLAKSLEEQLGIGKFEITYRPHPGALPRFDSYEIANPRIRKYTFEDLTRTELPVTDLKFIDEILKFDLVVGGPTTLLLEAMILGKPCVLDLTEDGYHRTTAGNAARRYTHLNDLVKVKGLRLGKSIDEFSNQVIDLIMSNVCEIEYDLEELFNSAQPTYADQLVSLLIKTK